MIIILCLSFSVVGFAQGEMRIEQVNSLLPEIKVWFHSREELESEQVTLELEGEILAAGALSKANESEVTHHYFLVDSSTSTTGAQMEAVKQSIMEFGQSMKAGDTMTLISFGVEVRVLLERESDLSVIEQEVSTLQANEAGTLFFDALAAVAQLAKEEGIASDRKLLYVFSDSVDYNLGGYTAEETQEMLLDAGLPLYAFGFDNGTKENLDNFGALARQTGGEISIINADNLAEEFAQQAVSLSEDTYVAYFNATTNVLPEKGTHIKLVAGSEEAEFSPAFHWSVADEIAPEIFSASQSGDRTIEIVFSELVTGANQRENYVIVDQADTPIGVSAVDFNEESFSAVLTLEDMPDSGELRIRCDNITDTSSEKNSVMNEMKLDYVNNTPEPEVSNTGIPIAAWVAIIVVVIGIGVGIIVAAMKKQSKTEDGIEQVYSSAEKQVVNAGESDKAHFVHESEKKVILEVANNVGASRKVTLTISKTLFVGRSDICDVVFDDPRMSRQHFVIEENNDSYTITNLSQGGTLLNGIAVNSPRPLNHGDKIEAGSQQIVFIKG